MKKSIIPAFAMAFALALSLDALAIIGTTFADNGTASSLCSDYNDRFIVGGLMPDGATVCNPLTGANWTYAAFGAGVTQVSSAEFNCSTPNAAGGNGCYLRSLTKNITIGMTCDWQEIVSDANNVNPIVGADADTTINNGNNPALARIGSVNGNRHLLYYAPEQWSATSSFNRPVNEWYNITIIFNSTTAHEAYFNNSDALYVKQTAGSFTFPFYFAYILDGGGTTKVGIRNIRCYNATTGAPQATSVVPDTTPPSITYFNLTNENGCENWNTGKSNPCSTSSVTPSVQFNTSENAWCAIGGGSSLTSLNYSDMGNSRNCTGAASGEGSKEHFCTLNNQDELVYDTSYLFISCKDSAGNQNLTSTSGALKLSITGLEAAGRTSIGIGIQNALLNSYINYTDLQIYARNLSNNQVRGTFDRAAKKGSKMWAFNRIGVSDSYINMFNFTPVLYTLEIANKTSSQITKEVETLINGTR